MGRECQNNKLLLMNDKYPAPMVTISLEEYKELKMSTGKEGDVCSIRYKNSLEEIGSFLIKLSDPRFRPSSVDVIAAIRESFERNKIEWSCAVDGSLILSIK